MAMASSLVAAMVDASSAASISKLNQRQRHGGLGTKLVSPLDSRTRRQEAPSLPALTLSASSNAKHTFTLSSSFSSASSLRTPHSAASVSSLSNDSIWSAKKGAPPIMPAIVTPVGPSDLSSVLLRNRIIFLGQTVNSQVAQRVISQLLMLAAIDEDTEIKLYINCPGGSTYSVLAIYDCMAWIKPQVSTICFGMAASQGALLLAGGEKGKRFAMPNARIMIHQPQGGCGGTLDDVRRQANEVVASRDKIDKMYAAFTGQPVERVQMFTERDRFFSAAEAMEFGLIDGLLETEY